MSKVDRMATTTLSARKLDSLLGDWRGPGPVYLGLADRIGLLILDGRITPDSRLPAERELSQALALSRTTVSSAYRELRDRGYLRSMQGSGSVAQVPYHERIVSALGTEVTGQRFNLTTACPPPWAGLREITEHTVAEHPEIFIDPGFDILGIPELRADIAARYTARGLPTTPDQIMVTSGAQHAIALASRFLISRGDRAIIESPSYPHAYDAFAAAGARISPITVSFDGWDADDIVSLFRRISPSIAYLIPDFHNPTGLRMPQATREALIRSAEREGTTLIVDETTAELSFDPGDPCVPFAAAVAAGEAEHVLTIGSVGKTVWGGLRVGWIRSTAANIRSLAAIRPAGDLGTGTLDQHVARAALGQMGSIRASRAAATTASYAALTTALAREIPEWQVSPVLGGVCSWVNLGSPASTALTITAQAHGVALTAGPRFGVDGVFERFVRLPLTVPAAQTDSMVDALAHAWRSLGATASYVLGRTPGLEVV